LLLNSYAKLNLYLEVLKQRKDNYHNIKTIFERIDLCDKIILKPRPDKKINLTSKIPLFLFKERQTPVRGTKGER